MCVQVTSSTAQETALRLGALLSSTSVKTGALLQAIEESGLTLTQVKVLAALGDNEDDAPLPASEIAASIGASVPTASRAIDALVKKRLVSRAEDAQDRRVRRIAITAKGARLVGELIAQRTAALEAFVDGMTQEQRAKLEDALDALLEREEIATAYRRLKEGSA